MQVNLLRALQEVAKGPNRPVIYTPPEMIPQWQPAYAQQLKAAVTAALDAGAAAGKVYKILDSIAAVAKPCYQTIPLLTPTMHPDP